MNLTNIHTLVVGLGVTGVALARFLKKNGAIVTITDISGEAALGSRLAAVREMDIRLELGCHRPETFIGADLIVLSPGVPHTLGVIESARAKGVPVLGEIELASRFIQEPIVAITGTNGKTTTTALLGEMLKKSGLRVFVGGNIGTPLIDYLEGAQKADVVVAEISSFQLDTIEHFKPKVAVLLNITQDHLDRYADFKAYIRSKSLIFKNQQENDVAILNGADPHIRSFSSGIRSRQLFFNHHKDAATEPVEGAVMGSREIILLTKESGRHTLPLDRIQLLGRHNHENVAAASLAALAAGGNFAGINAAANEFRGLPHRLEHIVTRKEVRYFNDSKSTTPDSVVRALEAFTERIVLIMGGRDKGSDFGLLKDPVGRQVKHLIVLGEAGNKIRSSLNSQVPTSTADTMAAAVFEAARAAAPGDVVLLSPGCASFDMYQNYAERGRDFSERVKKL
ncbi:MAG: UDP-N-acetylmuramoyl-L-alanine--D-glutamate ligase [Planctomycetes bacterium]|nr:UDP-N-acetylmuramoyl-L-alanine--D-glutamate ligase [Planctomycetota bacterium]